VRLARVDHVQLAMPAGREADARAFYAGLFGLTEVPKPPLLAKRGGAWFEGGEVKIHLGVDAAFAASPKAHVALVVDDLAGWLAHLRAAGVRIADDDAPLEGWVRAYAFDPFGNRIELMQPA
jgi:catechol 2,3-dioxygenase-like lactoylglutathione lyase family enzyme